MSPLPASTVQSCLKRKLIFVSGKGGVGKTAVSRAAALALAKHSATKKVLWVAFEDPTRPAGELRRHPEAPNLLELNCDAGIAFEEYMALKIGVPLLTKIFLQNKLIRYLAKAAPGIHELVLLGKIWHERLHYDHIVLDMPSTGYGLAMFQSTENFSRLFRGGPIQRDADQMLASFGDPGESGQLIVSLPEEMPLRESLELADFLLRIFPSAPPAFLLNKRFPDMSPVSAGVSPKPPEWPSPVASSAVDYCEKRYLLEEFNLAAWREEELPFGSLELVAASSSAQLERALAQRIGGWLG